MFHQQQILNCHKILDLLKVRWFRNDFLQSSISSKKQTKTGRILVKMNSFVCFLEEFAFEINWPLAWSCDILKFMFFQELYWTLKKLNDRPNSKDYFQNQYLNSCDGVFRSAIITKLYFTGIGYLGYNQFPHYTAQRYQSSFRWIYNYGSNKSTRKETGKSHLCALWYFGSK